MPSPISSSPRSRPLRWFWLSLFLVPLWWLAGCTLTAAAPTATVPPPTETPAPSPTVVPTYQNPIYPGDFPDPFMLRVDDVYYAYATNAGGSNVQTVRFNSDFSDWDLVGDALPRLPDWAAWGQSLTWAPSVLPRENGYVLYYTARYREAGLQCISRAVSDSPEGPFTDDSEAPFVCDEELGGSIDPSPFVDADGTAYLLWKNDGNCCGLPTGIWIQELSPDGLSLVGEPAALIQKDQLWEHPLVEGPALLAHEDQYYLFYSANWWESHEYAVGYAVCETITGPCVKPQKKPIFTYNTAVMGPGGQEFFTDSDGQLWMAYHAWTPPNVGYPAGTRSLRIEPVSFVGDEPVIDGPTVDPQPLP